MIKTIQRRLDAILHWNISFVGGFLGGYAILSHAGVFGSAQTGNLMEMASNVRFMEWEELGLRLLAMVIFACGVIASYMLTNYTNLHMRKLAIWVDAAGLGLTALLPDTDELENSEVYSYLGTEADDLYNALWKEVKSQ